MPRLAITLHHKDRAVKVVGLLDTGAAVSVIPYRVGLALGAVWQEQPLQLRIGGNIGRSEARALVVRAAHPELTPLDPVELGFAWTQVEDAPIILGQFNFFHIFNVCFYRAQGVFEIHPLTEQQSS